MIPFSKAGNRSQWNGYLLQTLYIFWGMRSVYPPRLRLSPLNSKLSLWRYKSSRRLCICWGGAPSTCRILLHLLLLLLLQEMRFATPLHPPNPGYSVWAEAHQRSGRVASPTLLGMLPTAEGLPCRRLSILRFGATFICCWLSSLWTWWWTK